MQTASDRAFFASVLEDTDVGVIPLPNGAELFVVARSPRAPERFVLDVELPDGARLRQAIARDPIPNDPPKSLEIVRGEETLGYIHPPIAIDADGEAVPATMTLDGQSIVLAVPHRDRDIRYPVNVDPEMRMYSDISAGWLGWDWNQSLVGTGNAGNFFARKNDCAYYCGLYQSFPPYTRLNNGSYAQWYYRAPLNSYLYRTTFSGIAHAPLSLYGANHTRAFQGLMNSSYTAWESNVNYVNQAGVSGPNPYGPHSGSYYGLQHDFCFNPRCDPNTAAASEQNFAVFGLESRNGFGGTTPPTSGAYPGTTTMAWANVYLGDRRPPSLTTATPASRDWTDEPAGTTHTITTGVHDDGLGIYGIGLDGAASGSSAVRHGCEGHIVRSKCPSDWSTSLTYTLNEGINTLTTYGQDFVGNRTPGGTWTEKIDRSAPSISEISGSLHAARNRSDDRRFEGLYEASYGLRVRATDAGSGVREIEIFVDGESQRARGGYSSSGSLDWELRPDDHPDDDYSVKVVVRDALAPSGATQDGPHVITEDFEVTVDRRGDIYTARQHTGDPGQGGELIAEEWAKFQTQTARWREEDIISTRTGVTCSRNGSVTARCGEVRDVSRFGEDNPGEGEIFTLYRGATENDERLQQVGELNQMAVDTAGKQAVARGPLSDVMQPWQNAPPAHGSTYAAYEAQHTIDTTTGVDGAENEQEQVGSEQVTVRLWMDEGTQMPVREIATTSTGEQMSLRYWTYERSRLGDADVPADFFRSARPAQVEQDKEVDYRGDDALGLQTEPETGRTYQPYALGNTPLVKGLLYCLATNSVETLRESGPDSITSTTGELAPGPLAPASQRATANYNLLPLGAVCDAGAGSLSDPALVVRSTERGSSLAQAWKSAYVEIGEAAQANPLHTDLLRVGALPFVLLTEPSISDTAYVITISEESSGVYLEKGNTAIVVTGAFDKTTINDLANALEAQ